MFATARLAVGSETTILHTNLVDNWITNEIEVQMPANEIVVRYHTNWFKRYLTNTVEVSDTAWHTIIRTNTNIIDEFRTNFFDSYQTNWTVITQTNPVRVEKMLTNYQTQYLTNWKSLTLTNIETQYLTNIKTLTLTNLATLTRTNHRTLSLTNWETVVIFHTNWTTQPLTNVVQVDASTTRPAPPASQAASTASPSSALALAPAPAPPPVTLSDNLLIEASRTDRSAARNLVEVLLQARWANNQSAPMTYHWRVERSDDAILCFGVDQEFKREVPPGDYNIDLKAQAAGSSALLGARAKLSIGPNGSFVFQQKPASLK